jgi:hypothetical protein
VLDISILGLWRWAARRGYVPLRIHSGGCGGEIKEVLENMVLGDIGRAGRGYRALLGAVVVVVFKFKDGGSHGGASAHALGIQPRLRVTSRWSRCARRTSHSPPPSAAWLEHCLAYDQPFLYRLPSLCSMPEVTTRDVRPPTYHMQSAVLTSPTHPGPHVAEWRIFDCCLEHNTLLMRRWPRR